MKIFLTLCLWIQLIELVPGQILGYLTISSLICSINKILQIEKIVCYVNIINDPRGFGGYGLRDGTWMVHVQVRVRLQCTVQITDFSLPVRGYLRVLLGFKKF